MNVLIITNHRLNVIEISMYHEFAGILFYFLSATNVNTLHKCFDALVMLFMSMSDLFSDIE